MAPPRRQTATSTRRPTATPTKTLGAGGRKPREPRATRTTPRPTRTTRLNPPTRTTLLRRHPLSPRDTEGKKNPAHRPGEAEAEAAGGNPGQIVPAVRTAAVA